jgi:hypothetical protein
MESALVPTDGQWIKKMWHIYAVIKNKVLPAGKWMELEIIILRKMNQTQKDKYVFSHM